MGSMVLVKPSWPLNLRRGGLYYKMVVALNTYRLPRWCHGPFPEIITMSCVWTALVLLWDICEVS